MPKKRKRPKEALKHAATKTLKEVAYNGARSYGIASVGSLLGSVMQNNANQFIQSFGNGSAPTMVVGVGVKSCRILIKYFRGEIKSVECLEQLGEENTKFLSNIAMDGIGQLAIPIPMVGALIGGFAGITMSKTFYNISLINEVFERYFHGTIKFFNELERVLYTGDADLAIGVNNKIQEGLGQKPLFGNKQECWDFITNPGRTEI
ncbi:hypothetical protein ACR9M1_05210 [Helicobacter pylori]